MGHDEIVEEIAKLSETTAYLKKQLEKPKSRLERFKEYAGVAGLGLSLATGCFAIYGTLVSDPRKSRADAQAKLHESLAQIISLDQDYLRGVQQGDPNATNGTLQSKRSIILEQAEDLARPGNVASFEDQINLGNCYLFVNLLEPAVGHFKTALNLAGNDPVKKASAETLIGRLGFYGVGGANVEQARALFDDAEHLLRGVNSLEAEIALQSSLANRSFVECSVGDPNLGYTAKSKADALLAILAKNPGVSPQTVDIQKTSLAMSLGSTRCSQDPTKPAGDPRAPSESIAAANRIALSNQILQLLLQRKFSELESQMSATLRSQVPLDRLQTLWDQLVSQIKPTIWPPKQRLKSDTVFSLQRMKLLLFLLVSRASVGTRG